MRIPDGFRPPDDDDDVNSGTQIETAPKEAVEYVLAADENSLDGCSQWVWVRLPNGDLVLGVFPQGDTYLSTEQWRSI